MYVCMYVCRCFQCACMQYDGKNNYDAKLTSLWGRPAAEKIGIFWPRAMLRKQNTILHVMLPPCSEHLSCLTRLN